MDENLSSSLCRNILHLLYASFWSYNFKSFKSLWISYLYIMQNRKAKKGRLKKSWILKSHSNGFFISYFNIKGPLHYKKLGFKDLVFDIFFRFWTILLVQRFLNRQIFKSKKQNPFLLLLNSRDIRKSFAKTKGSLRNVRNISAIDTFFAGSDIFATKETFWETIRVKGNLPWEY